MSDSNKHKKEDNLKNNKTDDREYIMPLGENKNDTQEICTNVVVQENQLLQGINNKLDQLIVLLKSQIKE